MKILHVGPIKRREPASGVAPDAAAEFELMSGLGRDGPSRSILGLARALASAGVDTAVLPTKPFQLAARASLPGVRFLPSYTGRKYNFMIPTERWVNVVEQEFGRPDLVNFHDVYDLFSVALASAIARRGWKYIVTPRGGLRRIAQQRDRYKKQIANPLFFRRYLRRALFIQALADGEAAEVPAFDASLHTVVIPNGIPDECLSYGDLLPVRPRHDDIVVGFLGQLFIEIKGIDILLEAVGRFQQEGGRSLRFVLAGPIGRPSDGQWLSRLLARLPDPSRVEVAGPKYGREKWELLQSLDVFVLASRTEGMPVVALEAMGLGKPCIFSRGTNMAGVIEAAGGGWDAGDSAVRLSQCFHEVAGTSREQLQQLGANARACVSRDFRWSRVAQIYLDCVRRAIGAAA